MAGSRVASRPTRAPVPVDRPLPTTARGKGPPRWAGPFSCPSFPVAGLRGERGQRSSGHHRSPEPVRVPLTYAELTALELTLAVHTSCDSRSFPPVSGVTRRSTVIGTSFGNDLVLPSATSRDPSGCGQAGWWRSQGARWVGAREGSESATVESVRSLNTTPTSSSSSRLPSRTSWRPTLPAWSSTFAA